MDTNSYINKLNKKFNSIIQKPYSEYIPFILLFLVMLFVHRFIVLYSDDSWFYNESQNKGYWEYITYRFNNWTGRMSVETTVYFIFKAGLMLWKIINPIMISLFAYFFSRILLGKDNKLDKKVLFLFNCLCCFLIGYINISVTSSSMFWATGSMYYLWVWVATLIALIPYRDSLEKKYDFKLLHFLGFLFCAAFGAWGQEQSALVMLIISVAVLLYDLIINKRVQVPLIIETIVIITFSIILFTAPGNNARFQAEMERWYPDFADLSLTQHLLTGIQWLLNFVVNEGKIVIIFIWILLSKGLFDKYRQSNKRWIAIIPILGVILISSSLISINNLIQIPSSVDLDAILKRTLLTFNEINLQNLHLATLLSYSIWGVLLMLTPVMIVLLYGKSRKSSICVLLLVLAFCSAAMIFFSPTIFASGHRVFFAMSILLLLLLGILILDNLWVIKTRNIILLSFFPLFQLLLVIVMWIKEHRTFI